MLLSWFSFVDDIMADFCSVSYILLYFKFLQWVYKFIKQENKSTILKQSQILQTLHCKSILAYDYGRRPRGTHHMLGVQNDEAVHACNFMPLLTVSGIQMDGHMDHLYPYSFKFMTLPLMFFLRDSHFLHKLIKQLCVLLYGISVFDNFRILE